MIYTYIITLIASALISGFSVYKINEKDAEIARLKIEHSAIVLEATNRLKEQQAEINTKYQEAINESRKRERKLHTDVVTAKRESDGLRSQLTESTTRLASATPYAISKYGTLASELLGECSEAYQGMAEQADRISTDLRLVIDAWPKVSYNLK